MSRKIKFHTFNALFLLFAYLADRTGGWRMFVRPKLLLGSLIVGLGLASCGEKTENKTMEKRTTSNSSKKEISKKDSIPSNKNKSTPVQLIKCYTGSVITKDNIDDKSTNNDGIKESLKNSKDPTQIAFCYSITDPQGKDIADSFISLHQVTDSDKIYEVVDHLPQFPGGDIALMNFLEKQIKYPSNESLSNINGKVICGFIVNKDGSISDITIYRSLDPILDSIAVKAIKAMPKFIPGKQNGQAVRVRYTLPIIFRTQE